MQTLIYNDTYFIIEDTLNCGQVFRFKKYQKGYLVISTDKICYAYNENGNAYLQTEYPEYFQNYFDVFTNYQLIVNSALSKNTKILTLSASLGKGIRILRQDPTETLFSFLISQNNNIPRIKQSIEKLAEKVGKKHTSPFGEYYAFPTVTELSTLSVEDYKALGLGYRAEYFHGLVNKMINGEINVQSLSNLSTNELYNYLTSVKGVGDKVANCVLLFGFYKTDSFPVDTWIEKFYIENYQGTLKNRKKITEYFINLYGKNAGFFQQYLFYYKRSLEFKN